jgi:hypothetical protein
VTEFGSVDASASEDRGRNCFRNIGTYIILHGVRVQSTIIGTTRRENLKT